jgi:heme O synthase-like polyprenyltransferase
VMMARPFFLFSILYLFLIFVALLADRLVFVPLV